MNVLPDEVFRLLFEYLDNESLQRLSWVSPEFEILLERKVLASYQFNEQRLDLQFGFLNRPVSRARLSIHWTTAHPHLPAVRHDYIKALRSLSFRASSQSPEQQEVHEELNALVSKSPKLQKLKIEDGQGHFVQRWNSSVVLDHVQELIVSSSSLSTSSLSSMLHSCPKLEHLHVDGPITGDPMILQCSSTTSAWPNLRSITSGARVQSPALASFIREHVPELSKLMLQQKQKVLDDPMSWPTLLPELSHLRMLDLQTSGSGMVFKGTLPALVEFKLYLSGRGTLRWHCRMPKLHTLRITSASSRTENALPDIFGQTSILSHSRALRDVETLRLGGLGPVFSSSMSWPTLERLVIRESADLTDEHLEAFLATCPTLDILTLEGCPEIHHTRISCPRLKYLEITACRNIVPAVLTYATMYCPALKMLTCSFDHVLPGLTLASRTLEVWTIVVPHGKPPHVMLTPEQCQTWQRTSPKLRQIVFAGWSNLSQWTELHEAAKGHEGPMQHSVIFRSYDRLKARFYPQHETFLLSQMTDTTNKPKIV